MLQSQTLQTLRMQPASVVAVGTGESGTGSRGACYQSHLRGRLGGPTSGRKDTLSPPLKADIPTHVPPSPTIPPPHPSCLTVYRLPQLGQRPKPGLDSYHRGSAPPSGDPTARCRGASPALLPSLPSSPSIQNTVNFAATRSASPCPQLNSAGLEGRGLR